jgi:uncharacterized protein
MTRRRWLATVAGAAAAGTLLDAFAIEPNRLAITRHRIGRTGGPVTKLVQLSDLHLRSIGRHEKQIAEAVAAIEPDLILITGDAIDQAGNLHLLEHFLALLDARPAKLAILGNWEHWSGVDLQALAKTYATANVQLLRNESVEIRVHDQALLVTGLDDLVGGTPDERAAVTGVAPSPNHLLLAHCPMHRDLFRLRVEAQQMAGLGLRAEPPIDARLLTPQLMLAGHTHGGQIAPFGWAPFRPQGSGRYVRGWYRDAPVALYVSCGLGTSVVHARLHAVPEIASFEWVLAAT